MSDGMASGTMDSDRAARLDRVRRELLSEQNLAAGAVAGLVASLAGALAWAGVTYVTSLQLGLMAIAVGIGVGYAIRLAGKGVSSVFGMLGGVLSILGCALGNVLALTALLANARGIAIGDALAGIDLQAARDLLVGNASPMDLVFYAIAAYEGYKLSFREIPAEELERRLDHRPAGA